MPSRVTIRVWEETLLFSPAQRVFPDCHKCNVFAVQSNMTSKVRVFVCPIRLLKWLWVHSVSCASVAFNRGSTGIWLTMPCTSLFVLATAWVCAGRGNNKRKTVTENGNVGLYVWDIWTMECKADNRPSTYLRRGHDQGPRRESGNSEREQESSDVFVFMINQHRASSINNYKTQTQFFTSQRNCNARRVHASDAQMGRTMTMHSPLSEPTTEIT